MRIRQIKPDFWKHVGLGEVSDLARFMFIGLWGMSDCAGRLKDQPKLIKAELFPYSSITSEDIDNFLNELHQHEEKFIQRYQVDGVSYIQISNFNTHQHLMGNELKATSKYPNPNNINESVPVRTNNESVPISTTDIRSTDIRSNGYTDTLPLEAEAVALPVKVSNSIWIDGVDLLVRAGCSNSSARSYLGMNIKKHGEEAVNEAVMATLLQDPPDPRGFIVGCLKNSSLSKANIQAGLPKKEFKSFTQQKKDAFDEEMDNIMSYHNRMVAGEVK